MRLLNALTIGRRHGSPSARPASAAPVLSPTSWSEIRAGPVILPPGRARLATSPAATGVSGAGEKDRDLLGRSLGSLSRRHTSMRHDDVDFQTDQLRGKVEKPFWLPLRPTVLNRDALTFHMAELAERLPEEIDSTSGMV